MLESILRAEGLSALAVGNVGTPVLEAVMNPERFDVLAVELSSYQLHWSSSISAQASAVLNLAPDHLDWHGGARAPTRPTRRGSTTAPRWRASTTSQDPVTERLVEEADVIEGCRAIGFTLGIPAPGMIGLVDDVIADRAFVAGPARIGCRARQHPRPGAVDGELRPPTTSPTRSLLRRWRVRTAWPPGAVRDGLRSFQPDAHRIAEVAAHRRASAGSTTPRPPTRTLPRRRCRASTTSCGSPAGWPRVRASTTSSIATRDRLRAAVLVGRDRALIAEALARHAPDVPVVEVDTGETGSMDRVVEVAASLAREGDTVLLAPAPHPWTSSATTPHGATASPRRSTGCVTGPEPSFPRQRKTTT